MHSRIIPLSTLGEQGEYFPRQMLEAVLFRNLIQSFDCIVLESEVISMIVMSAGIFCSELSIRL